MPTDCPTRERQGWTGDGQLASPVVSYNFGAAAFYRKWLRDFGAAILSFPVRARRQLRLHVRRLHGRDPDGSAMVSYDRLIWPVC